MKAVKFLIPVMLVLAVLVCVLAFLFTKKKRQDEETDDEQKALSLITSIEADGNNQQYPLVYNPHVKSLLVEQLQRNLNNRLEVDSKTYLLPSVHQFPTRSDGTRIESLKVDGYFGPETLAVVKYFWNGKEEVSEAMANSITA